MRFPLQIPLQLRVKRLFIKVSWPNTLSPQWISICKCLVSVLSPVAWCLNLGAETPNACSVSPLFRWLTTFLQRASTTRSWTPRTPRTWLRRRRWPFWVAHATETTAGLWSGSGSPRSSRWAFPSKGYFLIHAFQSSVDKMMQKANNSMMVGSSSWLDQFTDAFTVQAGECALQQPSHLSWFCNVHVRWTRKNQQNMIRNMDIYGAV